MADIESTYGGGSGTTTTRAPGVSAAADFGSGPDTAMLGKLLARRVAQRDEERHAAMAPQPVAYAPEEQYVNPEMQGRGFSRRMSGGGEGEGGGGGEARPQAAQAESDQGEPHYVKMLNIAGSVGGYVPAQAWEPGAIFAGYMPRGQRAPQAGSASFQDSGQPSGAALDPRAGAGQATASAKPRAIETGGGNPYATGVGVTSGNPYATGVGVERGRYKDPRNAPAESE